MATLGRAWGWSTSKKVSGVYQEGLGATSGGVCGCRPTKKGSDTSATSGGAQGSVERGLDPGSHALPSLTPRRSSSTRRSPSKPPVWSRTTVEGPSRPSTCPEKRRAGVGSGRAQGLTECRGRTELIRAAPRARQVRTLAHPTPFQKLAHTLALFTLTVHL